MYIQKRAKEGTRFMHTFTTYNDADQSESFCAFFFSTLLLSHSLLQNGCCVWDLTNLCVQPRHEDESVPECVQWEAQCPAHTGSWTLAGRRPALWKLSLWSHSHGQHSSLYQFHTLPANCIQEMNSGELLIIACGITKHPHQMANY